MVDTPEQRRMGIKDSHELALNDRMGSAQFDRPVDAYTADTTNSWPVFDFFRTPNTYRRPKLFWLIFCRTHEGKV